MMAQESDSRPNEASEKADKLSSRVKQYSKDEFQISKEQSDLGSGGYGQVRKYHHKDKMVAIKEFTFKADEEEKDTIWNMVLIEANILCRFHHENIVEFLGITKWPKRVGIILEYIDGGNLQDLARRSDLSWNTRLEIAKGITSGLEYIHNYGKKKIFCHGDLKPQNILLTKPVQVLTKSQVKLADFGSAAFYRATSASATTIDYISSKQYTLNYVAPEFLEDNTREKNPAMDMYSFGMLLYELICKTVPFSDCPNPNMLPALMMTKNKPNQKLIDETGSQLNSDDDRTAFNLLKNVMESCWSSIQALRPSSKTVKMVLEDYGTNQQKQPGNTSSQVDITEKVDEQTTTNERQNDRDLATTRRKIISRESYASRFSARQPSLGDRQLPTSVDIVPPKTSSRVQATSDETLNAPVKMELDSCGMNQQKQEENLRHPDGKAQNVDAEITSNKRKNVRANGLTRRKIFGGESFAPRSSAQQSSVGDGQLPTSFDGMRRQRPSENTSSKKITNKTDIVPPKTSSRVQATSDETLNAPGSPMLFDNKKKVEYYLEAYRKDLLSGNFEAAENCLAALRSFHANDAKATAEDIRLYAEKLQSEEKYLQSVALFDTAATVFAKLKNPADDLKMIQHCVQGMKQANQAMVEKDRSIKVIVKEHVIPLMRNWARKMKGASEVSEKWRCHAVSWALSNIEGCQLLVGQIDERKQTLEEAVNGMREVFGSDVYKQQGRLFGNLLDHLAGIYNDELRFDEATSLYRKALKAREVAEDYFGDEEDRKDDIRVTENNLQKNLKDSWEKQMRM